MHQRTGYGIHPSSVVASPKHGHIGHITCLTALSFLKCHRYCSSLKKSWPAVLGWASNARPYRLVRAFIQRNIGIISREGAVDTLVQNAIGKLDVRLLEIADEYANPAAYRSASYGGLSTFATMLQGSGTEPYLRPSGSRKGYGADYETAGLRAVLWAASHGRHMEAVRILLASGVHPDRLTEGSSIKPLHIAATNGHLDALAELLSAEAKINMACLGEERQGNSTLTHNRRNGYRHIYDRLVAARDDTRKKLGGDIGGSLIVER